MNISDLLARPLIDNSGFSSSHAAHPSLIDGINNTIEGALASAGLDTTSGVMRSVTDTIQKALSTAGLGGRSLSPSARGLTLDATAREIDPASHDVDAEPGLPMGDEGIRPGDFQSHSYSDGAGTLAYKLYVPACYGGSEELVPLIVMLHGCTQSPDDFAAGTQMNALADRHGFVVAYPAQSANANGMKCWNWFRTSDQRRDRGEPSLIAGMTREIASNHRIDKRRIFVAGMSAGAAMAVVLGATYPDLFAAVGAHSGLAYGAARDMPSAIGAMNGAGASPAMPKGLRGQGSQVRQSEHQMPTIVFHGDQDHTVNPHNGAAIVAGATASTFDSSLLAGSERKGMSEAGRAYSVSAYADAAGRPRVEHWVLHGAGHAWSGGSSAGSYTDPTGPDASSEMVRFFYAQQRGESA